MNYRLMKRMAIVAAVLPVLTGCGVLEQVGLHRTPAAKPVPVAKTQKEISDNQVRLSERVLEGEWNIYEVNGKRVSASEESPYVNFEIGADRFYAFNGCNVINGDFVVKPGQLIEFTNALCTQRYCPDMDYEYAITQAINSVRSYSLEKRGQEFYLHLHDKSHLTVLTLRKHNLDFLNGAWRVTQINDMVCMDSEMLLLIDIPEGKLHGNTGCNVINGVLSEDPDKVSSIQFQNIVSTQAACEDQARETALVIALEEVETARRGHDRGAVLLDKNGKTLLVLVPAKLRE